MYFNSDKSVLLLNGTLTELWQLHVQSSNGSLVLTLKLSGTIKQWNKKYGTCHLCIENTFNEGLFGHNQSCPEKKKKSLQLPFECLPLHTVFEKSIKDFAEFFNPSGHF